MAINTIKATMQMRRGIEDDFDPTQMTAGEWAVSTDAKYVRMCFMPGLCLRMATYEAFEEDMQRIQQILSECQDIKTAVQEFVRLAEQHKTQAEHYSLLSKSWAVGGTGERVGEDTNNSMYYSRQSESYAHGGTGFRVGEDIDNSEYYSKIAAELVEEAKRIIAAASSGSLIPAGTIPFEKLPESPLTGFMYNISNDFITDDRFEDGAGIYYSAGNNVYWNTYGKWDVLTGIQSYDFMGTKAELDAKIEAGEVVDGMKVYLTDVGGGEGDSSGGEIPGDFQNRIEELEEKTQINTWNNAGIVGKAIEPEYSDNPDMGYSLQVLTTWAQTPIFNGNPSWVFDWRSHDERILDSNALATGSDDVFYVYSDSMLWVLKFYLGSSNTRATRYRKFIDTLDVYRDLQYYGNYGYLRDSYKAEYSTYKYYDEFILYGDADYSQKANVKIWYHFATVAERSKYREMHFIVDRLTFTKSSGVSGNLYAQIDGIGSNRYERGTLK